jgi:hypothetical protein
VTKFGYPKKHQSNTTLKTTISFYMITSDVKSRLLSCFKEWAKKEGKSHDGKVVEAISKTLLVLSA